MFEEGPKVFGKGVVPFQLERQPGISFDHSKPCPIEMVKVLQVCSKEGKRGIKLSDSRFLKRSIRTFETPSGFRFEVSILIFQALLVLVIAPPSRKPLQKSPCLALGIGAKWVF